MHKRCLLCVLLSCAGAVFPLLFGTVVYPMTGLNPNPKRFLSFLGVITLESFASRCASETSRGPGRVDGLALLGPALLPSSQEC